MIKLIHHVAVQRVEKSVILPHEPKPQAMLTFVTARAEYTFNLNREQVAELREWLNRFDEEFPITTNTLKP
jgi:hypothetical protein